MSNQDRELFDLTFDSLVTETPAAYGFSLTGDDTELLIWIPKSVCGELNEAERTIEVQQWWLEKEGLV